MKHKSFIYGFLGIFLLAVTYMVGASAVTVYAAQPSGIAANVATTSNPLIGTTGATLFATSTCSSRVITTYASPIMLTFSDYAGQTPTATFGHLQSASTTVVYDASVYGCGRFQAYSFVSGSTTVSEMR